MSDTAGLDDMDDGREGKGEVDEAAGSAGGDGEGVGEEDGVEVEEASEGEDAMGYFCL